MRSIESHGPILETGALLFDMDGLLVDSEPLWFEVERDFARARGAEFTNELGAACVGRGLRNTLIVMRDALGLDVDPDRDVDLVIDAFIARAGNVPLKPGAAALLEESAARVPVALASSSHGRLVRAVLGALGIADRFGAIVSGDLVVHPKPAPDVFLLAAERLGVAPARCVVLEDSHAGVVAGRAAGMRVVAVPESDPSSFHGFADVVVPNLVAARAHLSFLG